MKRPVFCHAVILTVAAAACSSNSPSDGTAGTASIPTHSAGSHATAGMMSSSPTAGMMVVATAGKPAQTQAGTSASGSAGTTAGTGSAGHAAGGSGGSVAAGASGHAGGSSAGSGGTGSSGSGQTMLTGTLGALGAAKPTQSALWISNGLETLIYLVSAPMTCEQMKMSAWLSGFLGPDAQVVEIVVKGAAKVGSVTIGGFNGGEANYAAGAKSSAYEKTASGGTITFTKAEPNGVIEGTVMATYANPTGDLMGSFHADYCAGGTEYR